MKHDAKLISSVANIRYYTNLSLFSETEREAFLILSKKKKYLITDKRYSESVKKFSNNLEIIDSGAIHFLVKEAKDFFKKENIRTLEFEEKDLTVWEYLRLKKQIKAFPADFSDERKIKILQEIIFIKRACSITDLAFKYILTKIKLGVTEKKISDDLISFFKKNNSTYSFLPIVAFGKNSAYPHHTPTNTKLRKNQIVLLDFGVKYKNYCSDMTRTIYYGKPDEKFKNIYNTVLKAQEEAVRNVRTGEKGSNIDTAARNIIVESGFETIPHATGHGIGLEVHESPSISPNSKDVIRNNMVFSIEPGVYIPGYGGVRIEDLVLVRSGKTELISKAKRAIIQLNG
jgi:Xaa-Pro aminopeptidase